MKYCLVIIILFITVYKLFADSTANVADDTLAFAPNSKLYDCALISGLKQNTQLLILQNSKFEYYHSLFGMPFSVNYSLDGVELNNIRDGGINLMNFSGSYYRNPEISSSSGFNPISTIEFKSEIPEKSGLKAHTYFGNNSLLANIEANYRKSNFFILTHANYNNQNAYKVSERKSIITIDSNNHLLNTEFDGKSIFIKSGIIENNSLLTAEYLHVNNFRNIPQNFLSSTPEYLKENQFKMNLMSIIYESKLTSNASLHGNFYYRDNNRILDSYDDSLYSSQQRGRAYREITKEQLIGFNISTLMDFAKIGHSEIGAFYKRMELNEQANYGTKPVDHINEILGLKWRQVVPIGEKIAVNANLVYKYTNPVYPSNNGLANQSLVEFSALVKHKLSDNLKYSVSYSQNAAYPYLNYIYSTNSPVLDNIYCDIAQLNIDFRLFDIPINLNGFYSNFSNYFNNSGDLTRLTGKTAGGGVTLKKEFKFVNINFAYTYLKQIDRNIIFPKLPENNLYLSLNKEYDIGLKWQFEGRIFTDQSPEQNHIKLLDFWVQQRIIDHINLFIFADNIINEYYELFPGFPAKGFNFCFGLNFEI